MYHPVPSGKVEFIGLDFATFMRPDAFPPEGPTNKQYKRWGEGKLCSESGRACVFVKAAFYILLFTFTAVSYFEANGMILAGTDELSYFS